MISNGYDQASVVAALSNRIGWRKTTNPDVPTLTPDNLVKESGRFYESFHAAVAVSNVFYTQEDENIEAAGFNVFLKELKVAVIMNALDAVFSEPQLVDEPQMLFDKLFSSTLQRKVSSGQFVGQQLIVSPGNYAVQIIRAGLLFDQDVSFTLYLYSELKAEPVFSLVVQAEAKTQVFVELPDWIINSNDGCRYFLGYYQDELGAAKAIQFDQFNIARYKAVGFAGMAADANYTDKTFDRDGVSLTLEGYGLNLEIGSYRDYTNQIIRNVQLFDELQGLQMAIQVIEQMLHSTRSNIKERITGEAAIILFKDLSTAMPTQKEPFEPGLRNKIKKQVDKVRQSFFPKPTAVSHSLTCYS